MQPNLKTRKKFYEKLYKGYEGIMATWFLPSEIYAAWRMKSALEKFFAKSIRPGMKILDIGCGIGNDIFSLNVYCNTKGIDADFVGMDISEEAINIAKRIAKIRGYGNCRFFDADFENYKLAGKFDIILCSEVLEHTIDMKSAIRTIYEHLNAGGTFILSAPFSDRKKLYAPMFVKRNIRKSSDWSIKRGGKHMIEAVEMERKFEKEHKSKVAHTSLLTLNEIKKNVTECGFEIEDVKRSFIAEGNRWFDDHPMAFAALIVADRIIPFKKFGMSILIKAVKN